MRFTSVITLATSFLFSVSSYAAPIKPHFPSSDILPSGTRVGLIAKSPSSTLLQQNNDQLFPPASTLKLMTALAAKIELGDNFRYSTQVEQNGKDLVIRFSGDPSLTSSDISQLLKNANISTINGNLILNNSAFTGYEKAVGWPWDILGVCYSTPSSAITLNGNCVMASIYTNADGSTRVFTPKHQPVNVSTTATAITRKQQKEQYCDLELTTTPANHYRLSGCLVKRDQPLPLNFAVQNSFLYASATLHQILNEQGIKLKGSIQLATTLSNKQQTKNTKVLAKHLSVPLPVLLEHMLKDSDNLYANNLTKTLGEHYFNQAGSFSNGTDAIKQILKKQAKVDLSNAILEDGSGLSRNNRVSPNQLYSVLKYIKANDHKLDFIRLMPTAGIDGTLKYRSSMRKAPIKGNIVAKSGSLFATHNMAGFVLNEQGKPTTMFVQLITDYHPQNNTSTIPPLTQFEQAFYQNLIKATVEKVPSS
ncbi:serine-type D-Ala-D-Ala carboxypeptidase [Vibrio algivorus]|uniref:Serine-type D-Ala-D-Ala carboxypeptidase n=1 Tax=Vibrio algivorus TaxID=1667024 RepID=A0A557PHC5_9VIBR|nr:serine-type D-Ala-D-Ala carboxypeptidase [Vibrio algivorus]TVO40057.1 serine-type D-Ala-D-Ala carboxypeptidase [Vibrio algivorus]